MTSREGWVVAVVGLAAAVSGGCAGGVPGDTVGVARGEGSANQAAPGEQSDAARAREEEEVRRAQADAESLPDRIDDAARRIAGTFEEGRLNDEAEAELLPSANEETRRPYSRAREDIKARRDRMEAERHQLWIHLREYVDGTLNLGDRGEEIRKKLKECELAEYAKACETMQHWIVQIRDFRASEEGAQFGEARKRSLQFVEGRIKEFTEREAAEKVEWRRAEYRRIRETCEDVRRAWLEE